MSLDSPNLLALETRALLDAEMRRLGIRWRSPRMKAWMQKVSQRFGHPVECVADVPTEALLSLCRKLQATPIQQSLLDTDGEVSHG